MLAPGVLAQGGGDEPSIIIHQRSDASDPKPKVELLDARALKRLKRWLYRDESTLREPVRRRIAAVLPKARELQTLYAMRRELSAVWGRSKASREQLVKQLQDWCRRAEHSGIEQLAQFSLRIRSYA